MEKFDSKTISAIDEKKFNVNFKFNDKEYSVFETKKSFTYEPENPDEGAARFYFETYLHLEQKQQSQDLRTGMEWR